MKKITRTLFAALAVVSMAACTQEIEGPVNPSALALDEFGASTEASTKVTIADWKLSWEAGDLVDIHDGTTKTVFAAETAGESTVLKADDNDFAREAGKTYYAVFPSSDANAFDGQSVTLTVAGDRTAVAGQYPAAPAVGVTAGEDASFIFRNVCGLVSFEIAAEQNITSVVIFGGNSENVAGTVEVNAADATYALAEDTGVKEIRLTPAEGDVFAAGRYYVAVLPQEFQSGLSVTLYKNDGTRLRKNLKAFTLGRSTHVDVETGGTFKTEFTIKNADELVSFLEVADKCAAGTVATLANDIDLSGVTLPAVSTFAGTFDGDGHSLKNWTTDGPLFTKIVAGATVKNLILDTSCTLNMKETDDRQAFVVAENAGTVSGCTNKADITYTRATDTHMQYRRFGTIVGRSTGLVSDCHNEGDIAITIPQLNYTPLEGETYRHQMIGGVVGTFAVSAGTVGVSGCTNSGDITFDFQGVYDSTTDPYKTLRPQMIIGGVCGLAGSNGTTLGVASASASAVNNGTIENCTNSGKITFNYRDMNGGGFCVLGGVIGYIDGTITGCVNESAATVSLVAENTSATRLGAPAVGGVAGVVQKGNMVACSNKAAIVLTGPVQNAGTAGAAYTGGTVTAAVGGVVAKMGGTSEDSSLKLEDCLNSGNVSVELNAAAESNIGGVVGWTSVPTVGTAANKLQNDGIVYLKNAVGTLNVGGVMGQSMSTYSKVYNSAEVKLELDAVGETHVGGIAGYLSGSQLPYAHIPDPDDPDNTNKSTPPGNLVTGQNSGNIVVTGGESDKILYLGGVIGLSEVKNMSHLKTSWAECNTNTGDIDINSPLRVIVGGVIGREKGTNMTITKHKGGRTVSGAKNRGNITITNPGDNSRIGGLIGQHGQGVLGNANNFGRYSPDAPANHDYCVIKVIGANNTTTVGGYVGYIETTNGGNTNCSMVLSGCGFYGEIDAPGAVAGLIVGTLKFSGNSVTNGTMLGVSDSERPKLHADCKLNGKTIGLLNDNTNTFGLEQSTYFGKISPNANSSKKVQDTAFFCKSWNSTILNSFADGLQNY